MGDKTSSATNTGKTNYSKNEGIYNKEGGFFSDVPLSGSLSKSQIALNKYVKKNLLYDEEAEYKDDDKDEAYFSKESSPNESVSKSDSESLKSNESFDNKNQKHYSEVTTFDEILEPPTIEKESNYKETLYKVDQTDDYKSMHLLETTENTEVTGQTNDVHVTRSLTQNNSVSLNDLMTACTCKNKNYDKEEIYPETISDVKKGLNRHTVHDFTEWGNRTTIYPDVYAPLPYSEYCLLFKSYCHTIFHASLTSGIHDLSDINKCIAIINSFVRSS